MRFCVLGAGGHARVVISTLMQMGIEREVIELFDDDPAKLGREVDGVRVLGSVAEGEGVGMKRRGVVAIGDNRTRKQLVERLAGWEWMTVVHPKAFVDRTAKVGPGTVVFAGATVQTGAKIGEHVIINTGATVDHDCQIEGFAHLAPGVHLGGGVMIGEGALIGIGAVVIPNVRVGPWSIVGAGAAVVRDVAAGSTVAGVPARALRGRRRS